MPAFKSLEQYWINLQPAQFYELHHVSTRQKYKHTILAFLNIRLFTQNKEILF